MRKAIFIVMGAILAVGIAFAQTDPWWHPLNPQGGSHGVTYGTQLPTLVNTGLQPTDGLLAVQITSGAPPNFQMYDQSTASWFSLNPAGGGLLTDNTVPVWDTGTNAFIDSGITDDAVDITITGAAGDIAITSAAGDDILLTTGDVITVAGGQVLLPNGTAGAPAIAFSGQTTTGIYWVGNTITFSGQGAGAFEVANTYARANTPMQIAAGSAASPSLQFSGDVNTGIYFIGADNPGFSVGGALVMGWENTNAAGAGADLVTISSTLGIMNGGDTVRGGFTDLTSVDHTGTVNDIIGWEFGTIAADINAGETGIIFREGWENSVQYAGNLLGRESFNQPFVVRLEADFTAKGLADTNINVVLGSPSGSVMYFEEQTKGTSSWTVADGDLDISADDGGDDNEGVEIILSDPDDATSSWVVAQTDTLCFTANLTTTLIAGTDQMLVGWRTAGAFDAAINPANYTFFGYVGQTNIDGSIFLFVDDGDSANDDSGINIANGSTNTYKACVEADGGVHGYLNGTEITNTLTTAQLIAAGTNLTPFISYLGVTGTDAAILIHHWEITAN